MFAPRMARLCRARVLVLPRQNVAAVVRAEINATRAKTTKAFAKTTKALAKTIASRNEATAPVAKTIKARVEVTAALARTPGRRDRDEASEVCAGAKADCIKTLKAKLAQSERDRDADHRRADAAAKGVAAKIAQAAAAESRAAAAESRAAAAESREANTKALLEPYQYLGLQGVVAGVYRYITLNHPLPEYRPGGGYTDVNWSRCPTSGLHWEEWEELLRENSLRLQEAVGQELLPVSTHDLQRMGEDVKKLQLGNEQPAVEVGRLLVKNAMMLLNKAFENDKRKARHQWPSSITSSESYKDFMAPESYEGMRELHPDGGVKRIGERGCFLVYEVKAAHKFSNAVLKAHFADENLFIEEAEEELRRQKLKESGQKPKKRTREQALRFGVASVGLQARSYMLHCGVEYGFLIAGNTIVLFHFRKENPMILYHKVLEPHVRLAGVPPEEWTMEQLRYTPVYQLACFMLAALDADPPRGREYKEMIRQTGDRVRPNNS